MAHAADCSFVDKHEKDASIRTMTIVFVLFVLFFFKSLTAVMSYRMGYSVKCVSAVCG